MMLLEQMAQPLIAGGIVFAVGQGYCLINKCDVPVSVFATSAGMMGASKLVADLAVKNSVQRAVSAGALFAGLSYLLYKDESWALNGALGVSASYIADVLMPAEEKSEEE